MSSIDATKSRLTIACSRWHLAAFITAALSACLTVWHSQSSERGLVAALFPTPATIAMASVTFDNCTGHFIANVPPSQLTRDIVTISLCKGGVFALSYDKPFLNPQYATWSVTPQQVLDNIAGRVSSFRQDVDLKALKIPQANASSSVWSTLYNRGHIAPSRMLSSSEWGKFQTYYYSNVAPQWWQFNQQGWQYTEDALFDAVGARASEVDAASGISQRQVPFYVITGVEYKDREAGAVVFDDSVAMPDYFYTAVCNPSTGQSMAFIGQNLGASSGDNTVNQFLFTYRTVREVEMMFSSTSGTLFDDRDPISDAPVCNTKQLNASYWQLNRFDFLSTWPENSTAADQSASGNVPSWQFVSLTADNSFVNETVTNYSEAVAIDTFQLTFEGSEWQRLLLPKSAVVLDDTSAATHGFAPLSSSVMRERYEANNGNHSVIRDALLSTFRGTLRNKNGFLQWPAHGFVFIAKRMYYVTEDVAEETTGGSLKKTSHIVWRGRHAVPPSKGNRIARDARRAGGLAAQAAQTVVSAVFEVELHRLRSLSFADNRTTATSLGSLSVPINVTSAVAESLSVANFSSLLSLYTAASSAARNVTGPPSYAYSPKSVLILGSDEDAAGGNSNNVYPTDTTPRIASQALVKESLRESLLYVGAAALVTVFSSFIF